MLFSLESSSGPHSFAWVLRVKFYDKIRTGYGILEQNFRFNFHRHLISYHYYTNTCV